MEMHEIRGKATYAAGRMSKWADIAGRYVTQGEGYAGAVAARQYWRGELFAWLMVAFGGPSDHLEINALIERAMKDHTIIHECFDGGTRRPRWISERMEARERASA